MKKWFIAMVVLWVGNAFAADDNSVLLGINEGVSEQQNFSELQEKYKGLADVISKAIKRPVKVEASQNFGSSAANLKKARYDIMFARPSNVAGKAMRDNQYSLVAAAKMALHAEFIVNKDSPLKSAEDLRGKRLIVPQKDSLMTKVALATLRDMKIPMPDSHVHYARLMETVASMVESKFGDAGVVSPLISKDWIKNGNRVLFQSKAVPGWSVIASKEMSADEIAKIRTALVELETNDAGKKQLAKIGVKSFIAGQQQEYLQLVSWLGE